MGLAGYVINAVVVEGLIVREDAHTHGVSKSSVYELLTRYRAESDAGLIPRSKRPRSTPNRATDELEEHVIVVDWMRPLHVVVVDDENEEGAGRDRLRTGP